MSIIRPHVVAKTLCIHSDLHYFTTSKLTVGI